MSPDVDIHDRLLAAGALLRGFLSENDLTDDIVELSRRQGKRLGELLIQHGRMSEPECAEFERRLALRLDSQASGDTLPPFAASILSAAMAKAEHPFLRRFLEAGELPKVDSGPLKYLRMTVCGEGGLGKVWLARDLLLGRDIALKQIRPEVDSKAMRDRFRFEARVAAALQHPNILPVFDAGQDQEGCDYYVMPFVRGKTLDDIILALNADKSRPPDPVEFNRTLAIFANVCDAVMYAHSAGVVHRDLKPANVMVGEYGEVLVLDWGLACVDGATVSDIAPTLLVGPQLTGGGPVGSPLYMAPEQAAATSERQHRAVDVFALGGILFRLLTGEEPRAPRDNESLPQFLARIAVERPRTPREVDRRVSRVLDGVCAKAMASVPAERYSNPSELGEDVRRWMAGEAVSAIRERWDQRTARWLRHRWAAASAFLAALVVLLVASGAFITYVWENRARTRAQRESSLSIHLAGVAAQLHASQREWLIDAAFLAKYAAELSDGNSAVKEEATRKLTDFIQPRAEYLGVILFDSATQQLTGMLRDRQDRLSTTAAAEFSVDDVAAIVGAIHDPHGTPAFGKPVIFHALIGDRLALPTVVSIGPEATKKWAIFLLSLESSIGHFADNARTARFQLLINDPAGKPLLAIFREGTMQVGGNLPTSIGAVSGGIRTSQQVQFVDSAGDHPTVEIILSQEYSDVMNGAAALDRDAARAALAVTAAMIVIAGIVWAGVRMYPN